MFGAIRNWWFDGRRRKLAGLFAFEFAVVMLGVLAAQGLADWAEDRGAQRRLDVALERIRRDAGYNMAAAEAWQKSSPCLDQRMALVMRAASAGAPLAETDLRRPTIRFNYFEPLSEGDDLLLRQRGDERLADTIQQFDSSVDVMAERLRQIADQWAAFELLDPVNGPVLREDRVVARHNASAIRAHLRGVDVGSASIMSFGEALGADPVYDPGERLPRDCAEIWSSGRTMIVDGRNGR